MHVCIFIYPADVFDILIRVLIWHTAGNKSVCVPFFAVYNEKWFCLWMQYIRLLMWSFSRYLCSFIGLHCIVAFLCVCVCQVYFESRIRKILSAFCLCPLLSEAHCGNADMCVCMCVFLSWNDRLWKYIYLGIYTLYVLWFHYVWKGICSCCQRFRRHTESVRISIYSAVISVEFRLSWKADFELQVVLRINSEWHR